VAPKEQTWLRIEKLTKHLGGRAVVDDVSLQVHRGEIVGLLGPNGAGKTTLFRLVSGLLSPEEGQVFFAGKNLRPLQVHQRAHLGLGYLPQEPGIFTGLSVRENIAAALELCGKRAGDVEPLLHQFGLQDLATQKASTLSGGERRKVELARLLAGAPQLMLLDEPFKALDSRAVQDFSHMIRSLVHRHQIGVLLTDHSMQQTLSLCDRIYLMTDGRVVAAGTAQEVLKLPLARQSFWGGAEEEGDTTGNGPNDSDSSRNRLRRSRWHLS
jgi:lipopolysaccharide export system ATP-binding protein